MRVEQRRGGWFAMDDRESASGPWRTKEAASAAGRHDYDEAWRLEREAIRETRNDIAG